MPAIVVGADRLNFIDEGSGPAVVLIHGSCGGAGQWKSLAAGVRGAGFRSLCVDLLGAGDSSAWPVERVWRQGDDTPTLSALLDNVREPVHLVLHSGAGLFAYPLLEQRPQALRSLTLFEPVFFGLLHEAGDPTFAEPRAMASQFRARRDAGDEEGAMAGFVDTWARAEGVWAQIPEPMKARMRTYAARLYHEWAEMPMPLPRRGDLERLRLPTLLLKGSDTIASLHALLDIALAAIPEARLVTLAGAGHMAPFTHADAALPAVVEHLRSVED